MINIYITGMPHIVGLVPDYIIRAEDDGYCTLPCMPGFGIPAGILADYIEEYVYNGVAGTPGASPRHLGMIRQDDMRRALIGPRLMPLYPCYVTISG